MLSINETLLIFIIVAAIFLILSNRLRTDLVAVLVLVSLTLTGLVTADEAVSGFSRSAVIVIIGLFVITHTLEDTGVVQVIANRIRSLGGESEARLVIVFMAVGALLSLTMNNIAAGAVLMPAAIHVSRESNVRLSKLLIPLSFGTLVGGMATYFTTANIILSGILQGQGLDGLDMMDFIPTGGLIVIATLAFMVLIGRRLLPDRESVGQTISPRHLSSKLRETYQLDERLWEVRVPLTCKLVNTALSHSHIGSDLGITVVAIWRGHEAILAPEPIEIINANDYLLILGREERVRKLAEWGLMVGRENGYRSDRHDYSVDLTEVIIPPRSNAIGKTLKDLRFRNKYGLTSVAFWREGRSYRTDVGNTPLQVGDALLMVGPISKIKTLAQERDYLLLQSSHVHQPPYPDKALWALLITGLVLITAIFDIIPLSLAVLAGWAALVLTRCMTMDEAYRSIEWRVVFLIAGMLPISIAMVNTGLADRIGMAFVNTLVPFGPLALVAGIFLLTAGVTQVMAGQVSALIVGPIAITAAQQMGVNPQAMAVAVAIGCSTAFLTPIAHPVNVLMMGPGGYRFSDFFKIGLGMTLVTFVVLLIAMMLIWGIG
jgi:di/tricarboxylate transporter